MAAGLPTALLTQQEFTPNDHAVAERVARRLGYEQYAYTSTSALWGLFCLPENPATAKPGQPIRGACIIKTRELGMLVVQDLEDLGLTPAGLREGRTWDPVPVDDVDQVRHTACRHCGQDIEGIKVLGRFPKGDWRDRGNNTTCPDSKRGRKHAPVRD